MLTIQELGPVGDDTESDLHEYELLDGERGVTKFIHKKGSGLSTLLHRAANAVELEDYIAGE